MPDTRQIDQAKQSVHDFWDAASCGEVYSSGETRLEQLASQARERYRLEPYIHDFAKFREAYGKRVLEIGVGMGADHLELAKAKPRSLTGIDLTPRAVEHTRERLTLNGFVPNVKVDDAENLSFPDESFDLVYSYGVLHHSPDTARAIREVLRVLAPGGTTRIMIYHSRSMVGYMLWLRYGMLSRRSLKEVYAAHLESPGTKAFTVDEARAMFRGFSTVHIATRLGFGDLLQGEVGQRHRGALLTAVKLLYPRWLIKALLSNHGLGMMITAVK